jgi:hypothetical protein
MQRNNSEQDKSATETVVLPKAVAKKQQFFDSLFG